MNSSCKRIIAVAMLLLCSGCSKNDHRQKNAVDTDSIRGTDSFTDVTPDTVSTGDSATGGNGDSETGSTDSDNLYGILGNRFRYGINGGHRNAGWGDDVQAQLEVRVGCTSQRISLPERHLDQWGYEIEVNDMNAYQALGMHSQVAFLTSPIRTHSTAPESAADWELAYYMPANLYEPTTLESGEINPDNYWAKYVYDTVKVYHQWIKVWEIWNEPDYTPNWSDTLTWTESAPTAAQLPRFNGSIFEYIRMLRVSREAAKLADPEALIATGGIGYASFLSAILRYTDNPTDGTVTTEYPNTGAGYFDVLSFHHYPIYTAGNSDAAVQGYLDHADELLALLKGYGKSVVSIETTESGAPHVAVGDYPGGPAYARNYVFKVMVSAHAAGIHGIDWYTLSDGAVSGASQDPYDFMGLFEDVVALDSIDEAQTTQTGTALATASALLDKAIPDAAAATASGVPANVKHFAFRTRNDHLARVFWAALPDESTDTISVTVPEGVYDVYAWDYAKTGQKEILDATTGGATINVGSSPTILVEN